ncbi:sulfotransferase family protein [Acanthopleuribacter pedis]|uniref:Sulfotransferase n=1 Tax=Acanthopleuribacter pedis TaxID=442870 RepID=A0A8J7QAP5_9BACT|nr:sulfotransferase [Acanthopleuribacter pedis]MBO1320952.1 sulfotransferase [Acanthopleuribacter pedis]
MDSSTPVFVLCSPRCGSTLLRVMLAGNRFLFAPPELHLMQYDNLAERDQQMDAGKFMAVGLVKALAGLDDITMKAAQKQVRAWCDQGLSSGEVYAQLIQRCAPRVLVDKTPTYSEEPATLERIYTLFPNAKFIHLIRHPYAVMDSVMRLNQKPLVRQFVFRDEIHGQQHAEQVWRQANQNCVRFLGALPAEQHLSLRYEDLVRDPENSMGRVCTFLDVPYEEAMVHPYQGDRMTAGIAIGDVNFHNHKTIDAGLADIWQERVPNQPISSESQQLAAAFGYRCPQPDAALVD